MSQDILTGRPRAPPRRRAELLACPPLFRLQSAHRFHPRNVTGPHLTPPRKTSPHVKVYYAPAGIDPEPHLPCHIKAAQRQHPIPLYPSSKPNVCRVPHLANRMTRRRRRPRNVPGTRRPAYPLIPRSTAYARLNHAPNIRTPKIRANSPTSALESDHKQLVDTLKTTDTAPAAELTPIEIPRCSTHLLLHNALDFMSYL